MEDRAELVQMAERYLWLLSELHAGNSFTKDKLWRWLRSAVEDVARLVPSPTRAPMEIPSAAVAGEQPWEVYDRTGWLARLALANRFGTNGMATIDRYRVAEGRDALAVLVERQRVGELPETVIAEIRQKYGDRQQNQ